MKLEKIREYASQLEEIARKHGILRIYVFGSVARGDTSPHSDVDFLVEMDASASLFGAAGFAYDAEKLLGVPVDVVPVSVLSTADDTEFSANIRREAIVL